MQRIAEVMLHAKGRMQRIPEVMWHAKGCMQRIAEVTLHTKGRMQRIPEVACSLCEGCMQSSKRDRMHLSDTLR